VSRRLRRLPIFLLPLVLLAGLTACGDDEAASSGSDRLDAVTIEGAAGEPPEVTWNGEMTAGDLETEVLEEGDGAEVKTGDQVVTHIWIGNGFTQKKSFSTYDEDQPETVTVDENLSPIFADAMLGQTVGSRVAVTASGEEAFGPSGNPQLEIGNKDSVLVIIDLISIYEPPKPVDVPESKLPGIVLKKGEPVALDFTGLPEPKADGDLLRSIVKQGKGATVTPEMTVTADYLGQVYDAKKPFDESYSKEPVPFALTGVVQGWTQGLSGVKVGSRVLLQIPPALGYGEQEQENIPANSTLYFVVDIISAK